MKAAIINKFGGPEVIEYTDYLSLLQNPEKYWLKM